MIASILPRHGVALAHRAVRGGCCSVRHALIVTYQRIGIWLAMMAMVGIAGLVIALGLRLIGGVLPLVAQLLSARQA